MLTAAAQTKAAPWLLVALGLLLLVTAGMAGWAGNRWATGNAAIDKAAEQTRQLQALSNQISDLADDAAQLTADYAAAADRLNAIAEKQEHTRAQINRTAANQQQALAQLLAARTDIAEQRLGADVLRHWNISNSGTEPAAAPAAADSGQPDPALPAAAGSAGRPLGHAAGQPRRGSPAVPPVPQRQGRTERGAGRVAEQRLAVVLRRPAAPADRRTGVPA